MDKSSLALFGDGLFGNQLGYCLPVQKEVRDAAATGGHGRKCYKCGQAGHISRDCFLSSAGVSGNEDQSFACYVCGEYGHLQRDCPLGKVVVRKIDKTSVSHHAGGGLGVSRGSRSKKCYNCGQLGHISKLCPLPQAGGNAGGAKACYNCGMQGHISRDCPNANKENKSSSSRGTSKCYNCGKMGHIAVRAKRACLCFHFLLYQPFGTTPLPLHITLHSQSAH